MARAPRVSAQISAMIRAEDREVMDRIADDYELSFGEVMRLVVESGLPAVAAQYPRKATAAELEAAERARSARRG